MKNKIRVRFAPSPTGPLHIGGVRTALFNYLFAKKNKGDFVLRIEDTDQSRLVPAAEDYIKESLAWLGIKIDESNDKGGEYGPYKQSERKDIYKKYVEQLIQDQWAYYAFDTPEELQDKRSELEKKGETFSYDGKIRGMMVNSLTLPDQETKAKLDSGVPYVVRLKMPENKNICITDMIRGEVNFKTGLVDDKVIFKSDGLPTYHLANVVDDYLMKISHVIRGEEWLPSLPFHAMLYEALGWEEDMPTFAHLPLILKPNGKGKLSKRDGDKEGFPVFPLNWTSDKGDISMGYREAGYFPEAVVNILAFLGWNPGTEQEIFSIDGLIESFSFDKVNKSGSKFDPDKARWFNHQYIQQYNNEILAEHFMHILKEKGADADVAFLSKTIGMVKERVNFVHELWDQMYFFFMDPEAYDKKTRKKAWKEKTPALMEDCLAVLEDTVDFTSSKLEENIKSYITENELGFGLIMNPLRLAIVGAGKGPHLFDIMEMIGKEATVRRIRKAIDELS